MKEALIQKEVLIQEKVLNKENLSQEKTLVIEGLCAGFPARRGEVRVLDHVSLSVPKGKITGLVGESGCGKSMTARAVMNLIRHPGRVTGGRILLEGRDLLSMRKKERRMLQGREIAMIFQDPMSSLNPVMKVGKQVDEAVLVHEHVTHAEAKRRTLEMLEAAGVPDPERRYHSYPHQLSGGLRQRIMIAMAMVCRPKLLIADEPTTALDVTVEAQILDLMKEMSAKGTAVLLISHNLGAIARVCDDVSVMYAGKIVEQADICTLFDRPRHPYTRGLLSAVSSLRDGSEVLSVIPGHVPNLARLPAGCSFSPRCSCRGKECMEKTPEMREISPGHRIRCLWEEPGKKPGEKELETEGLATE